MNAKERKARRRRLIIEGLARSPEDVAWQARHSEYELAMLLTFERAPDVVERLLNPALPVVDMRAAGDALLALDCGIQA